MGRALSQVPLDNDLSVAYASRVMTKAERAYSTIERELAAIIWVTSNFGSTYGAGNLGF